MKVAKAIIVMFFYNSLRVISSQESIEDPSSDNVDEHENAYSLVEEVEDERLHELSPDLFGEDKQDAWEDLEQKGKNSSLSSFKASDFSDQDTTKKSRATMIKQQAKKMGLNVEELKQLLYDLQEDEEEKRRKDFYSTTFEPQYEQDDRTLLDVFGEAAKGYLTQNMVSIETTELFLLSSTLHSTQACYRYPTQTQNVDGTGDDCNASRPVIVN
jgi:hypothetical protein